MTRQPRIKGKELIRALERAGLQSTGRAAATFSSSILMEGPSQFLFTRAKPSGRDCFVQSYEIWK
jgi:hypothetical protein